MADSAGYYRDSDEEEFELLQEAWHCLLKLSASVPVAKVSKIYGLILTSIERRKLADSPAAVSVDTKAKS